MAVFLSRFAGGNGSQFLAMREVMKRAAKNISMNYVDNILRTTLNCQEYVDCM